METRELLKALGNTIGIELAFDDYGVAAFLADGMKVTLRDLPEIGAIAIEGDLGAPPPEDPTLLYKLMLESQNRFRDTVGATISLDPETGRFMLCRVLVAKLFDASSFVDVIGRFLTTQDTWTRIVHDYRGGESIPAPAPEMLFGDGFLRV